MRKVFQVCKLEKKGTKMFASMRRMLLHFQFHMGTNQFLQFYNPKAQAVRLSKVFDEMPLSILGQLETNFQLESLLLHPWILYAKIQLNPFKKSTITTKLKTQNFTSWSGKVIRQTKGLKTNAKLLLLLRRMFPNLQTRPYMGQIFRISKMVILRTVHITVFDQMPMHPLVLLSLFH